MKKRMKRGDQVADCGHIDGKANPDQEVRILHLGPSAMLWWTEPNGQRDRVPCEWLICCVACYAAAGGDARNVTIPALPAPHDGPDVDLDGAEPTAPLEQLGEAEVEAMADMMGEDVAELSPHDRRRVLGRIVAREFAGDSGENFASWFLAADAVKSRLERERELALWAPPAPGGPPS